MINNMLLLHTFTRTLFIVLCWCVLSFCQKDIGKTELFMVQAIFRHGERTTDTFYPTDPYVNYTFHPFGKGGLTNRGKWQEYKLGQLIRKRYDSFLGDIHTDGIMEVRSTGFGRTRKSALLVLAGLWPPKGEQIWNKELSWQPIPVDYKPYEEDDLINPGVCARRIQLLKKQPELEDVKKKFIEPFKDLMMYLEEKTKHITRSPNDLVNLYLILRTEEGTNLTLPEWTKSVYPQPLYNAASLAYSYVNYHSEVIKINSGYLLKKMITDFNSKINGTYGENDKKILLYSGHESTIGQFLDALHVKPHVPSYASTVLLELHKLAQTDKFTVRILYKREEDGDVFEDILLPGCDRYCPLNTFQDMFKNILPTVSHNIACKAK